MIVDPLRDRSIGKCKTLHIHMLHKIAWVLVIIGGLAWGLIGFFNVNLVTTVFGSMSSMTSLSAIVYDLVGLSAVYLLFMGKKM